LFFEEIKSFKIPSVYFEKKQIVNSYYSDFYSYSNSASVFRPPIFIS
jgi:hypothetical protein